jgi:hypothetical protein
MDEVVAIFLNGSHLPRPAPHFVHRNLNVVFDGGAVKLVRARIGSDRAEQIDPLLIRYFLCALRLWSRLPDDKNDHAAVIAVGDVAPRPCARDNLLGIHDGSLLRVCKYPRWTLPLQQQAIQARFPPQRQPA